MKMQRIRLPDNRVSWTVLDDDQKPVAPIDEFLRYLETINRSPNTVRAYAQHLLTFWQYGEQNQIDWQRVSIAQMVQFTQWLRQPKPDVIPLRPETQPLGRKPSTINAIVSGVISFYQYHESTGRLPLTARNTKPARYQPFLAGIADHEQLPFTGPVPKKAPPILTAEQVQTLIAACGQKRDQFLLALLYQTGMRIGQALGLRLVDMEGEHHRIRIVPRDDNANGMRAKTDTEYVVHISDGLLSYYDDYLIQEYPDIDIESNIENYVFVVLKGDSSGQPLTYPAVVSLFNRLSNKTGIKTHPHVFRHTHVTELHQAGVDLKIIQERVGHKSIQTTMNTYVHLTEDNFNREIQDYIRGKNNDR